MIAIKANFERQVRRTSVDNQDLTFNKLTEALSKLFNGPISVEQSLIKYLDDEEELVDISSDVELKEAVRISNGNALRLFISTKPQQRPQHCRRNPNNLFWFQNCRPQHQHQQAAEPEKSQEFVHPAVCDSCDNTIKGIRNKCKECPDYDLCNTCIVKKDQVHDSNHTFTPLERSSRGPLGFFFDIINEALKEAEKDSEKEESKKEEEVLAQEEKKEEAEPVVPDAESLPAIPEEKEEEQEEEQSEDSKQLTRESIVDTLARLEAMGFDDKEKNIQSIIRNQGHMPSIVAELLD
eukprot:TRINITY_DN3926_c0_g1_i2.p2 TRINITY_DN3926_c0_g1~~TRINITY_DN3926_c0_g1_i2.p2  ORF type:complete len:294 (+),score=106.39 TRINITY_DN3926_c0_g1_i2:63-944(+)